MQDSSFMGGSRGPCTALHFKLSLRCILQPYPDVGSGQETIHIFCKGTGVQD